MYKKLVFSIIAVTLFQFCFFQNVFGQTEPERYATAQGVLMFIRQRQFPYHTLNGVYYPECPKSVCWNTPSIDGSTDDLISTVGATYFPDDYLAYRCRWQNDKLYCFAYRCEENISAAVNPAKTCKQQWRIQVDVFEDTYKCFDVDRDDGVCPK